MKIIFERVCLCAHDVNQTLVIQGHSSDQLTSRLLCGLFIAYTALAQWHVVTDRRVILKLNFKSTVWGFGLDFAKAPFQRLAYLTTITTLWERCIVQISVTFPFPNSCRKMWIRSKESPVLVYLSSGDLLLSYDSFILDKQPSCLGVMNQY